MLIMSRLLIALVAATVLSDSAPAFTTQAQNLSYSIGVYIARNLGPAKQHFLDPNAVAQGLKDATAGRALKYSDTSIKAFSASYHVAADTAARTKLMSANKDLISYAEGANFGRSMLATKRQYDFDLVAQGIVDGLKGAHPALTEQQMQTLVSALNVQSSGRTTQNK
jgi:hypothetical protein